LLKKQNGAASRNATLPSAFGAIQRSLRDGSALRAISRQTPNEMHPLIARILAHTTIEHKKPVPKKSFQPLPKLRSSESNVRILELQLS